MAVFSRKKVFTGNVVTCVKQHAGIAEAGRGFRLNPLVLGAKYSHGDYQNHRARERLDPLSASVRISEAPFFILEGTRHSDDCKVERSGTCASMGVRGLTSHEPKECEARQSTAGLCRNALHMNAGFGLLSMAQICKLLNASPRTALA